MADRERRLTIPQFTTTIDDIEIHFIHQRSSHADVRAFFRDLLDR